ncbi:hypothetical protein [Lolliginicoccus levis]|uniref:hypothetical protein n=1 Tax=Lolliginicoccus levis TaxID=2919542 RepID=UPI00241C90BC|nr:hypothetical protein [Lolliginicoccus levis]
MASLRAGLGGHPAQVAAIMVLGIGALVASSDRMTAFIQSADSENSATPADPVASVPDLADPVAADLVVPARTALAVACSDGTVTATGNATIPRAALSTAKLYLAEHVLSRPGTAEDELGLVERMIARSDDRAADILDARHPGAINSVAERYDLQDTLGMDTWGVSLTSAADLVVFLQRARDTPAGREVLALMATTEPVAADGEMQDWGVAQVPGVVGVKLGWSDWGVPTVASVGFSDRFIVAGSTIGSREQHTADLGSALEGLCGDVLG